MALTLQRSSQVRERTLRMWLLEGKKVPTYFQMLAEIVHDPPESDPFLCFLMFQVPFHVSLVAFSFQKFHFPPKKITQTREPH